MKSPGELSLKLARQWQNPDNREKRLLNPDYWPIKLTVGKPTNRILAEQTVKVKAHLDLWRNVGIGKVHWESITYRATGEALSFPVIWELQTPSDWIAAADNVEIKNEFRRLEKLAVACDPLFHRVFIRQRHLINGKPEKEIIKAAQLVMLLEPDCALGKPLRTLSLAGIDSKFFERHRTLISKLLDIRFDYQVRDMGLEAFLGALDENDHWLLLADLDGTLLPFAQQRVRAKELLQIYLPGKRILIVENEKCYYHLPTLKDTLAILGAGLNLTWLKGPDFSKKQLAYWGDIDTWGLTMLAKARCLHPGLTPLMMTNTIFDRYGNHHAVQENIPASHTPPQGLTTDETALYNKLLTFKKNRLEQEFLPEALVVRMLKTWKGCEKT
jgi:hypothetical protein